MTLCKFKLQQYMLGAGLEHVRRINAGLAETLEADVFPPFADPDRVLQHTRTGVVAEDGESVDSAAGEADAGVTAARAPVLSPTAQVFAALMEEVYEGWFDECFKRCATMDVSVSEVVNGEPIDGCSDLVIAFQKAMRGCGSLEVVAASASGAPPRALIRNLSDESNAEDHGAAQRERDGLWKTAHMERKKYVNIFTVPRLTKEALTGAYQKCTMFKYAGGKDSNRAFVCSADLLCEHPTEPWSRLASPPDTVLRAVCDWMKEFKGAHDFIVLFDGRSKENVFRLHTHTWPDEPMARSSSCSTQGGTQPSLVRDARSHSAPRTSSQLWCTPHFPEHSSAPSLDPASTPWVRPRHTTPRILASRFAHVEAFLV